MQTLYGIKITDRVTVTEYDMSGVKAYGAFFDGGAIGKMERSGALAVRGAIDFLEQRARDRQQEIDDRKAADEAQQNQDDTDFLEELAGRLGILPCDLEKLIEIANRRKEA